MSSSDSRIIKLAKISAEPVVVAMQDLRELDVSALEAADAADESGMDDLAEIRTEELGTVPADQRSLPLIPMDEAILQAAREEAQAILEASRNEAAAVREQARQEGMQQGYEAGMQQGLSVGLEKGREEAKNQLADELRQAADQANAVIARAQAEAGRILADAEPQIIELVLAISRKVIHDETAERPSVVVTLVKGALERVRNQDRINIHVSPDVYELVLSFRQDLQVLVGAEKSLTVTVDSALQRGGCLIETSFGTVEAGIDSQLEVVRRTLKELLP